MIHLLMDLISVVFFQLTGTLAFCRERKPIKRTDYFIKLHIKQYCFYVI